MPDQSGEAGVLMVGEIAMFGWMQLETMDDYAHVSNGSTEHASGIRGKIQGALLSSSWDASYYQKERQRIYLFYLARCLQEQQQQEATLTTKVQRWSCGP